MGELCGAFSRTLLSRLKPFLEQLDNLQIVYLKKLQVPIPVQFLVRELQMLYVHACLPKEPHSEAIVRSMRACFAYSKSTSIFERFLSLRVGPCWRIQVLPLRAGVSCVYNGALLSIVVSAGGL